MWFEFTLVSAEKTEFGYRFQAPNREMAEAHISRVCQKLSVSLKKVKKGGESS